MQSKKKLTPNPFSGITWFRQRKFDSGLMFHILVRPIVHLVVRSTCLLLPWFAFVLPAVRNCSCFTSVCQYRAVVFVPQVWLSIIVSFFSRRPFCSNLSFVFILIYFVFLLLLSLLLVWYLILFVTKENFIFIILCKIFG